MITEADGYSDGTSETTCIIELDKQVELAGPAIVIQPRRTIIDNDQVVTGQES